VILLALMGCDKTMESWSDPWIPSISVNSPAPTATATAVRRLEDYLVPTGIDTAAPARADCVAGEDVRGWYQPTYAFVEVQRWGVLVNGSYTTSLDDGLLNVAYASGQLLPELYDSLLGLRTTGESLSAGMPCWPDQPPRLLLLADESMGWSVLQRVVHTAWQAGFDHVDVLVSDPTARAEAEAIPPRPAFVPGARSTPRPPDYLSEEEVEQGLEQLRRGYRLRPSAESCRDRLSIYRSAGSTHLQPLALGAGQLDGWQPMDVLDGERDAYELVRGMVEAPELVDVQVAGDDELSWGEIVRTLDQAARAAPGAPLTLFDEDHRDPSNTRLGTVPASVYQSYGHEQWVTVIELSPPSLGLSLACSE
jgi:hypothetical protein